jgi:hypothetical protein
MQRLWGLHLVPTEYVTDEVERLAATRRSSRFGDDE